MTRSKKEKKDEGVITTVAKTVGGALGSHCRDGRPGGEQSKQEERPEAYPQGWKYTLKGIRSDEEETSQA